MWKHPEIDNPEYSEDKNLYLREELCTVGLDLWQVKSGTIFDNLLFTDDLTYAKEAAAGVKATQEGEKKVKDAQDEEERKKMEEEAKAAGGDANKEDNEDDDDEDEDDNEVEPPKEEEDEGHDEL